MFAPRTNSSEAVNSSYAHSESLQRKLWEGYEKGTIASTGAGPSFEERQNISNRQQINQARQIAVELSQIDNHATFNTTKQAGSFYECRHRPDNEKERKVVTKIVQNRIPKMINAKGHLSSGIKEVRHS